MDKYISNYLNNVKKTINLLNVGEIERVIDVLEKARDKGSKIFIMGNGGSASNASHFVNGLSQGATVSDKPRFKAIALTDNIPNMLAYANDLGYEYIFVEQLKNLLDPGDIVIGISGSGNSKNVLNAIDYANENKAITIGFCGFNGGLLKQKAKYVIHVKSDCMEIVEDIHLSLTHLISSYFRYMGERGLDDY